MNRFLVRLIVVLGCLCSGIVLLSMAIGRKYPDDDIAYVANYRYSTPYALYRTSLSRHITRQVTFSCGDLQFDWSPDGQSMAVTSVRNSLLTIYVMDANGQNPVLLNANPENDYDPSWSPDGHSIVYVTERYTSSRELLLTSLDTKQTRRLTNDDQNDANPTWSPDNKHIIFISRKASLSQDYISNLDIESGRINSITPTTDFVVNPVWSPNGRYLLYTQVPPNPALYVLDRSTGQSRLLYAGNINWDDTPSWSPDSRFILFTELVDYYGGDTTINRLDIEACLQSNNCIPQILPLPLGRYQSPRWRPHTS